MRIPAVGAMPEKITTIIKEADEIALLSFFTKQRLLEWFNGSTLPNYIFPTIAITALIQTAIDWTRFSKAKNKNYVRLSTALVSTSSSSLVTSAIVGKLVVGSAFVTPPLFIAGLGVATIFEASCMIKNLSKACHANSDVRIHFLQASIKNALNILAMTAVITVVVGTLMSPVGPAILLAMVATAIIFTGIKFLWNITPNETKRSIKHFFCLSKSSYHSRQKPEVNTYLEPSQSARNSKLIQLSYINHRCTTIKNMRNAHKSLDDVKQYLIKELKNKIALLRPNQTDKSVQKCTALTAIMRSIEKGKAQDNFEQLERDHPKIYQSFFKEVSDTKALVDACRYYFREKSNDDDTNTEEKEAVGLGL